MDRKSGRGRPSHGVVGCSYVTAANALQSLVKEGCVAEITGQKRNKVFKFVGYLDLFAMAA
jgi:hypothetical protein